jgi:hypothetical protein
METKWFEIDIFFIYYNFLQKKFSEWKLFMANTFCKNWFYFQDHHNIAVRRRCRYGASVSGA